MTRIVGIAGSLRKASFNAGLLRAAAQRMPDGASLDIVSIRNVPLYNGDEEAANGIPGAVAALKEAVAQADALLIATPEYNNSIPGVLKNAIDWITRPPRDMAKVVRGKPVAVIGATPGGMGTVLAQAAWLPVMRTLGMRWYSGGLLYVSGARNLFDETGELTDRELSDRLQKYLAGFVSFVDVRRTAQ